MTTSHFIKACKEGNKEKFLHLLKQGADINCMNGEGLRELVLNGDRDIFSELIQHKDLKINLANTVGESALHCAAGYNKVEAMRMLLAHEDIQVNIKDSSGNTPVMAAVRKGCRDSLALLLKDSRVDLFVVDGKGQRLEEVVGKGLLFMKQEERRAIISMIMEQKVARENLNNESTGMEYHSETTIEENDCVIMDQESEEKCRVQKRCEENDSTEAWYDCDEGLDTKVDNLDRKMKELKHTECKNKENLSQQYENKMRIMKMANKQSQENLEKEAETEKNQLEEQYKLDKKELEKRYENNRVMIKQRLEVKLNSLKEDYKKSEEEEKKKYHLEQKLNEEKSKKAQNGLKKVKKEIKDGAKKMKSSSTGEPEVVSSAKRDLECPICMNEMKPPTRIFQCRSGHPICGDCNERMRRTKCPTCNTENIIGRAFALEQLARTLFQKE